MSLVPPLPAGPLHSDITLRNTALVGADAPESQT
jgi:hypothetical protein